MKMRRVVLILVVLAVTVPVFAQGKAGMVNYAADVGTVKTQLAAAGADLSGPCGAFAIVQRVAALHAAEGAGVLDKPAGNNCQGYAVDIIAFRDGSIADCLVDGGGANGPAWQVGEPVDPGRWRPSPFVTPQQPPAGPGEPPADPPVEESLVAILARLEARLVALEATVQGFGDSTLPALAALEAAVKGMTVTLPPVTFPVYEGSIRVPMLGSAPVSLKPKVQ